MPISQVSEQELNAAYTPLNGGKSENAKAVKTADCYEGYVQSDGLTRSDSFETHSKLFGNGRDRSGNRFALFLPKGDSAVNSRTNTLEICGETEIVFNVKGGIMVITFCENGTMSVEIIFNSDYGYTNAELGLVRDCANAPITGQSAEDALRRLLYAAPMEEVSFGANMQVNAEIMRVLDFMGIDTARGFSVNNHAFTVSNGVVHSSVGAGNLLSTRKN